MNPRATFDEVQAALESEWPKTSFGRSRFMRMSAAAVFGLAASAFLPGRADAHCPTSSEHPCFGFDLCGGYPSTGCNNAEAHCCSNTKNYCSDACDHNQTTCDTNGPQHNCWVMCHEGKRYRCCDCKKEEGGFCMCRFQTGLC